MKIPKGFKVPKGFVLVDIMMIFGREDGDEDIIPDIVDLYHEQHEDEEDDEDEEESGEDS